MVKLDPKSIHLKAFSYSSFANILALSSQLEFIIILCDKFGNFIVLSDSLHKSRILVRCVPGGDIYAFADEFDAAYIIERDLQLNLEKPTRLQMFTDSKSLFDIISKSI